MDESQLSREFKLNLVREAFARRTGASKYPSKKEMTEALFSAADTIYKSRGIRGGIRDLSNLIANYRSTYATGMTDLPVSFLDRIEKAGKKVSDLDHEIGRVADVLEALGRDLKKAKPQEKKAQGLVIGPKGLEKPQKINIVPNREYFMGASSSPSHIVVTKADDKMITYRKYPYASDQKIQRWIGEDLIAKGTKTWLSGPYAKYHPETVKSLRDLIRGGKGKKVNPKDFEHVSVQLDLDPGISFNDGYTFVKGWGVLTGTPHDEGKDYWEVETERRNVNKLKKDRRVKKVVSVKG